MTVFIANIHDIQVTNNNVFKNCENRECNCTAEEMDYAIPVLDRRSTAEKDMKRVRQIDFILNEESKNHTLFYYDLSLQVSLFLNGVSRYQTNYGQGR